MPDAPKRFCALSCIAALAAAWPAALRADAEPVVLAPVQVQAERVQLTDSAVVSRLTVEPLAGATLGELLSTVPGVQIRSSGGLGSYSEASLRGSSGRQVRVLLDGLPLDTGGGEAASLSLIHPLLLDEVEVYKGRVPVHLGSGLAGTINLRSRSMLPAPLLGTAALGSFGEWQLHTAAQLADSLQLGAGRQSAENDFRYRNEFKPFDPTDPDRRRRERRHNAGTQQQYGVLRYGGPIALTAHLTDHLQELPTRGNSPNAETELDTRAYGLLASTPEGASWQLSAGYRHTDEHFRDANSELGVGRQDSRARTRHARLAAGRRFRQVADHFTVEHTDYHSADRASPQQALAARRWTLSNGLEATAGDQWRVNAAFTARWSQEQSGDEDEEHWQLEPAVGLSRDIGDCLAATNWGRRERLPTFFERYGDRGLYKGNPALQPESAQYADLGVRCEFGPALRRLELTAFGQDLRDAISPTFNAQGIGRSINTEHAYIHGVEFSGAGSAWTFEWRLDGTWQQTRDDSQIRATRGRQLPGRFERKISTRLERGWQSLIAHYAFHYESGQYYDSANLLVAEPLRRHDVGLRGAVHDLGWSVQWLNLRNDNPEQFNGFPTPGRRLLLTLTYPALPLPIRGHHDEPPAHPVSAPAAEPERLLE